MPCTHATPATREAPALTRAYLLPTHCIVACSSSSDLASPDSLIKTLNPRQPLYIIVCPAKPTFFFSSIPTFVQSGPLI